MHYNFIYDEQQLSKAEQLFLKPFSNYVFTLHIAYRPKKLNEETKQQYENLPSKANYITKTLYPSKIFKSELKLIDNVLKRKIKRYFNLEVGCFDPFDREVNIPQQAFGIYMSVNPKDIHKATRKLISDIQDILWNSQNALFSDTSDDYIFNIKRELHKNITSRFSIILEKQRNQKWLHFEADTKDGVFDYLINVLNKYEIRDKIICIETLNGYHFLILNSDTPTKLYKNFCDDIFNKCPTIIKEGEEVKMFDKLEGRIPLPGTLQFGFKVKFIEIKKIEF